MLQPRPFALMHTADQWCRAAHQKTAVEAGGRGAPPAPAGGGGGEAADSPAAAGRARLRPLVPAFPQRAGGWAGSNAALAGLRRSAAKAKPARRGPRAFRGAGAGRRRRFRAGRAARRRRLAEPIGLACDDQGRLFVAERGAAQVLVYELEAAAACAGSISRGRRKAASTVRSTSPATAAGSGLCAKARRIFSFSKPARSRASWRCPRCRRARRRGRGWRWTWPTGAIFLLAGAGTAAAQVCRLGAGGRDDGSALRQRPRDRKTGGRWREEPCWWWRGGPGRTCCVSSAQPACSRPDRPFLKARGLRRPRHRGGAAAGGSPSGPRRGRGWRCLVRANATRRLGRIVTYRLDSGTFETRWGRLSSTPASRASAELQVYCASADEVPEGPELPRSAPAAGLPIPPEKLRGVSPPMPPLGLAAARGGAGGPAAAAAPPERRPRAAVDAAAGQALSRISRPTRRRSPRRPGGICGFCSRCAARAGDAADQKPARRISRPRPVAPAAQGLLARPAGGRLPAPLPGAARRISSASSTPARACGGRCSIPGARRPNACPGWLRCWACCSTSAGRVAARRRLIAEAAWLFRFRGTLPGLDQAARDLPRPAADPGRALPAARARRGDRRRRRRPAKQRGGRRRPAGGRTVAPTSTGAGGKDRHAHRFTVLVPAQLAAEGREVLAAPAGRAPAGAHRFRALHGRRRHAGRTGALRRPVDPGGQHRRPSASCRSAARVLGTRSGARPPGRRDSPPAKAASAAAAGRLADDRPRSAHRFARGAVPPAAVADGGEGAAGPDACPWRRRRRSRPGLERLGYRRREELCIREIRVPLRLRPSCFGRGAGARLGRRDGGGGRRRGAGRRAERVLRFASRRQALADFAQRGGAAATCAAPGPGPSSVSAKRPGAEGSAGRAGARWRPIRGAGAGAGGGGRPGSLAGARLALRSSAGGRSWRRWRWPRPAGARWPSAAGWCGRRRPPARRRDRWRWTKRRCRPAGGFAAAAAERPAAAAWRRRPPRRAFAILPLAAESPLAPALAALVLLEADPGRLAATPAAQRKCCSKPRRLRWRPRRRRRRAPTRGPPQQPKRRSCARSWPPCRIPWRRKKALSGHPPQWSDRVGRPAFPGRRRRRDRLAGDDRRASPAGAKAESLVLAPAGLAPGTCPSGRSRRPRLRRPPAGRRSPSGRRRRGRDRLARRFRGGVAGEPRRPSADQERAGRPRTQWQSPWMKIGRAPLLGDTHG